MRFLKCLVTPSACPFTQFNGFYRPKPLIPAGWIWLYYANPISYTLYGLIVGELGNAPQMMVVRAVLRCAALPFMLLPLCCAALVLRCPCAGMGCTNLYSRNVGRLAVSACCALVSPLLCLALVGCCRRLLQCDRPLASRSGGARWPRMLCCCTVRPRAPARCPTPACLPACFVLQDQSPPISVAEFVRTYFGYRTDFMVGR